MDSLSSRMGHVSGEIGFIKGHEAEGTIIGHGAGESAVVENYAAPTETNRQERVNNVAVNVINKSNDPNIAVSKIIFSEKGISVEKPPDRYENLALSGGGPKGLVYPDFLETLNEKIGLMKGLKNIVGTSAGSMMALLLSSGMPIDKVGEFVRSPEADMMTQMGGSLKSDKYTTGFGYFDAGNIAETLKNKSRGSALDYLDGLNNKLIKPDSINKNAWEKFVDKYENGGFKEGLTFGDLKILHEMNPVQFKNLIITGHNKTETKAVYFDAEETPDELCHEAARISMSLPFAVKSILDKDGNEFIDGGISSNFSIEAFSRTRNYKSVDPTKTLGLMFGSEGKAEKIENGIDAIKNSVQEKMAQKLTARKIIDFVKEKFVGRNDSENTVKTREEKQRKNIKEKSWIQMAGISKLKGAFGGPAYQKAVVGDVKKACHLQRAGNIGYVNAGKLDTFSFNADQKTIEAARREAKFTANELAVKLQAPKEEVLINDNMNAKAVGKKAVAQLSNEEVKLFRKNPQLLKDVENMQTGKAFMSAIEKRYKHIVADEKPA